jgi:hypothetical protein
MWWYWESHSSNHGMSRVILVYSFKEYMTYQRHVWVDEYNFWRNLWRATGMIFVSCKKIWDQLEDRMWPSTRPPDPWTTTGM